MLETCVDHGRELWEQDGAGWISRVCTSLVLVGRDRLQSWRPLEPQTLQSLNSRSLKLAECVCLSLDLRLLEKPLCRSSL